MQRTGTQIAVRHLSGLARSPAGKVKNTGSTPISVNKTFTGPAGIWTTPATGPFHGHAQRLRALCVHAAEYDRCGDMTGDQTQMSGRFTGSIDSRDFGRVEPNGQPVIRRSSTPSVTTMLAS
jgi:hypothetical protein